MGRRHRGQHFRLLEDEETAGRRHIGDEVAERHPVAVIDGPLLETDPVVGLLQIRKEFEPVRPEGPSAEKFHLIERQAVEINARLAEPLLKLDIETGPGAAGAVDRNRHKRQLHRTAVPGKKRSGRRGFPADREDRRVDAPEMLDDDDRIFDRPLTRYRPDFGAAGAVPEYEAAGPPLPGQGVNGGEDSRERGGNRSPVHHRASVRRHALRRHFNRAFMPLFSPQASR